MIFSTPKGTSGWFQQFKSGRKVSKSYSHSEDALHYSLGYFVEPRKHWPLRPGRQIVHVASGNLYELSKPFKPFGSKTYSGWVIKLLSEGNRNKIPLKLPNVLLDLHIKKDFATIPSKAEKILYEKYS